MSDTQGAQDTGSGGLENDMPAIGNAPSSPRMVPSALGGLAGFAQRALGIGRPAPQAAQPGPSPYQFPGRSQLPPPHPNAPRWTGTTASYFLPKNTRQPPANFTPFIGTVPKGDYENWGQPEEYPDLPQSFELPSLYQGLGKFFGQQSGMSGPLGLLMAGHADAYIKGVMQGQEFRAKMAKEKLLQTALELQFQQEQQHTTYADRMREYFELAGEDKAKAAKVTIKGQTLTDALHEDAMKLGDTDMVNMIESGATFDQIMRYQDFRDAKLKDLQKSNQKANEQDAEDAGFEGKSTGGSQGQSPEPFTPSTGQPQQFETPGEPASTPAPEPSGGAAPTMVASNDPFAPTPDAQTVSAERQASNPDKEAALGLLRGNPSDTLPAKGAARGRILRYNADMQHKMDELSGRAEGMSPDQIYDELSRNVDPTVTADLKRILNGAPIPGGWSAIGSRPYWQDMQSLARAIKPGWLPQDATNLQNFELGYNHGVEGQRMMRATIMGNAGVTLLRRLNEAEAAGQIDDNGVANKWRMFIDKGFTDDPHWTNVFAAYQTYIQENNAIATGKPYEGDIKRLLEENPITGGPQIIRGIVQTDALNAWGVLNTLNRDYQKTLQRKTNAPHFDEEDVGLLRGLTTLQPDGSFQSEDVPKPLKDLAKEKGKIPRGWTVTPIQ